MQKVIFILLLLAMPVHAHSAPFSTDSSSLLHFGGSAIFATAINTVLIAEEINRPARITSTMATCMALGAFKEFAMDAWPDYGDLTYDALGCAFAIGITEGVAIRLKKNAFAIEGRF